jgi:isopenicillin-N epimerase
MNQESVGRNATAASSPEPGALKELFLLDRDMVFLNHGSFGACSRPVFEVYQNWQRELEAQPVAFLHRRIKGLLAESRASLAAYLGTAPDNLVYTPNVTVAVNIVARSLSLEPRDEVLSTDLEYGAVDRLWSYACARRGARYVRLPVTLPVTSAEALVEEVWAGVNERTRVIALSHLTSSTALILPVEEICRRARRAGILTVIDGAHVPGHLDLRLDELGADFYGGNCHKWLCAPKGSGFLYARPAVQDLLEPFVVSWGYQAEVPGLSPFIDHLEWGGTDDPAAYLSVPAAIEFQRRHDWPRVRPACHALAGEARRRILALSELPAIAPDSAAWWGQMCTIPLPPVDSARLKARLWDEYRVEVPVLLVRDQPMVRVSVQAYNEPDDIDRLLEALTRLLSEEATSDRI